MSTKNSDLETYIENIEDILIDEGFYNVAEFVLSHSIGDDCPPAARAYIRALAELLGDRANIKEFVAYLAKIEMETENAEANS